MNFPTNEIILELEFIYISGTFCDNFAPFKEDQLPTLGTIALIFSYPHPFCQSNRNRDGFHSHQFKDLHGKIFV